MKKFMALILCLSAALTFTTARADNDKAIRVDQLPETSQQFIRKHFSELKVSFAKMETGIFDKSYEVIFTDGSKIEFAKNGNWTEVECKAHAVPAGIVPQQIVKHVTETYPDQKIMKISRDTRDYEVKLSNRIELKYDLQFNLIGYDD